VALAPVGAGADPDLLMPTQEQIDQLS
jgi:hypothetical protein